MLRPNPPSDQQSECLITCRTPPYAYYLAWLNGSPYIKLEAPCTRREGTGSTSSTGRRSNRCAPRSAGCKPSTAEPCPAGATPSAVIGEASGCVWFALAYREYEFGEAQAGELYASIRYVSLHSRQRLQSNSISHTSATASTNFFAHFFDLFGLEGSFQEWMRAYYESQAVASALNHAAIVHRARMSHDAQELNRPFTWKEKVTAIQGLNKMLSTELDRHKTGVVLLVMSTLALSDVDPDQGNISYTGPPLAFEALMMPPKEIRIVGQSGFPAAHLKATATLVQRIGGLQTLKLSGLPELIA